MLQPIIYAVIDFLLVAGEEVHPDVNYANE
jgi:hypothetical protein